MGKTKVLPEEILSAHNLDVQMLAESVRRLIKDEVPEAIEKAYPGWHAIGYTHPSAGYFCAIFPLDDRVQIAFEFGVLLRDPEGRLQGQGKQVRYLILHNEAELQPDATRELIREALALPPSRAFKLQLIEAAARAVIDDEMSSDLDSMPGN